MVQKRTKSNSGVTPVIPCIDCIALPMCMARYSQFKSTYMDNNRIISGMYMNCELLSNELISLEMDKTGNVRGVRCDVEKAEILLAYFESYG